jgi:hypothetical protein
MAAALKMAENIISGEEGGKMALSIVKRNAAAAPSQTLAPRQQHALRRAAYGILISGNSAQRSAPRKTYRAWYRRRRAAGAARCALSPRASITA